MSARKTCSSCGHSLIDGRCGPCVMSTRRVRRFRSWLGWLRATPPAEGTWVVRGRVIHHVDPLATDQEDEAEAPVVELVGKLVGRLRR